MPCTNCACFVDSAKLNRQRINATAEMLPVTWPEFSDLHPFAPADQAQGYAEIFEDLSEKLLRITGYDAFSGD